MAEPTENQPATGDERFLKQQPPLLTRFRNASLLAAVQTYYRQSAWYSGWVDYFYPPPQRGPNLIKRYDARPQLPVRIFFPATYDQTSPQSLPTLFTIHGGGFCIGLPEDDDIWNRTFADTHNVLVVALNYRKAPACPWPIPVHDVEALFLAVLEDESLPIDKNRTAIGGFSAGGNLSLALSQLPSVHNHPTAAPKAVIPIYAPLDFSITPAEKKSRRPYKKGMLSGIRGEERDYVLDFADVFDWAYIPYGQDVRDPIICPIFSKREDLPPYAFFIAAELDFLSWEEWDLASRLAGRKVTADMSGRRERAKTQELELEDERFSWETNHIRWLLVPDVIHAFDMHPAGKAMSDPETVRDGDAKALKVIKVLGDWLLGTAWAA